MNTNLKNNEPEVLLILGVLVLYMIGDFWPFTALPWFAYLIILLPIYSWSVQSDDKETRQALIGVERQKAILLAAKTTLINAKAQAIRDRGPGAFLKAIDPARTAKTDLLKAKASRIRAEEEAIRAETAALQKVEAVKDRLDKAGGS